MIVPLFTHHKLSNPTGERLFRIHRRVCHTDSYDMFLEMLPWFHRRRYVKFKLHWHMDKAEFMMKGRML